MESASSASVVRVLFLVWCPIRSLVLVLGACRVAVEEDLTTARRSEGIIAGALRVEAATRPDEMWRIGGPPPSHKRVVFSV